MTERLRRIAPDQAAAFAVPLALVLYLAVSNGGYGLEARSLVGIGCWLAVAVGSVLSARPLAEVPRRAVMAFGLLGALAAWTAVSFAWTENDGRTAVEVGRVLAYLGAFAFALGLQGRGNARCLLAGVSVALTAVCALALFSRLEPTWFPERRSGEFIPVPEIERRLGYPLNYSGGIATLVTMTLPLLLLYAWAARRVAVRVLAAAAIPMVLVTLWLTGSGLILAVSWIGAAVFVACSSDRLPKLASFAVGLVGGALLSFAVVELEALDRGLPTPEAQEQGDQLFALTVLAMIATGAAHRWILGAAGRLGRPGWTEASPGRRRRTLIGVSAAAPLVLLALGLSGALDSGFDRFRSLDNVPADAPRLSQVTDIGSSGRWQQWRSALDAAEAEPITGIGPGTFEFWWARNGLYGGFVRDGHSLYLETFAELGIVGLGLILAFLGTVLLEAGRLTRRSSGSERAIRAGVLGSLAAFAAAAGVDWMWELGVLPITFVLLAGAVLSPAPMNGPGPTAETAPGGRARGVLAGPRLGLIATAAAAATLILLPYLGERRLEASRDEFQAGDYAQAYERAEAAEGLQPFASEPRLQQALVLRRTGQLEEAIEKAREAVGRAPTDWRPRLILSRLQGQAGLEGEAGRTYREARSLNPRSEVFAE